MDRPPRGPGFICARPEGNFTPLVPLDEFPPNISIRGVSRILTPAQTQGMTSCGMARARTEPWAFEGASTLAPSSKNDLTELKSALIKMIGDNSLPTHYRDLIQNIMSRCLINIPCAQTTTPAAPAAAVPASAKKGTSLLGDDRRAPVSCEQDRIPNRKKYCSYWIRHGECDYLQQGCMYKHEMPLEPGLIEELGLRDIPRWYREKYNVPSLLHATYHRPQAQLAIAGQPQQKTIEYNEPSASSHDRGNNAENANHRVNNSGRFKASRGAHNGKARGNGRSQNSNRNVNSTTNDILNTNGMSQMHNMPANGMNQMHGVTVKGMGQMHNVPRKMTPDDSTSPGSGISIASQTSSMKTGPPLDLQTTTANSVSRAPTVVPVTSVVPPNQFGAAPVGFHAYHVPRFAQNEGMLHGASFSGRRLANPVIDCLEDDTSSGSARNFKSPRAPDFYCRQNSRRLYDFGCDGDVKKESGASPEALTLTEEIVESENAELDVIEPQQFKSGLFDSELFKSDGQTVPILSTMGALLKKLLSESEEIDPHRVLFNFGPIGEDVKLPPQIQCPKMGTLIDIDTKDVTPAPAALPAMYTIGQNAMYGHVNK
ncbi:hypothetical protein N7513_000980 [Penicillium frequentans]|nr:hypothetical protein N7513_000980 [Penicillium glabrum]